LLDAGSSRTRGAGEGGFQGRRWDSGEDIVSPYLWSRGIKKIDVVVLTHAHSGQAGGLHAVLDNFRVGEFWHPPQPETPEYAALLEAVAVHGIPTRTLLAGDGLALGGASIRVLWPRPDPPAQSSTRSDDSLAVRISAGGMSILLPGDAGKDAQKGILASRETLESQVLTVPHYGSISSASRDFLARVAPSVAIVSSEARGGGGDWPNPETLQALENAGARVFRTNTDGATTVEGSDGSLVVRTYQGSEALTITGGCARWSNLFPSLDSR
jgi:competence protein ComEC